MGNLTYREYLIGQVVNGLLSSGAINYSFPKTVKSNTIAIVNELMKEALDKEKVSMKITDKVLTKEEIIKEFKEEYQNE